MRKISRTAGASATECNLFEQAWSYGIGSQKTLQSEHCTPVRITHSGVMDVIKATLARATK